MQISCFPRFVAALYIYKHAQDRLATVKLI